MRWANAVTVAECGKRFAPHDQRLIGWNIRIDRAILEMRSADKEAAVKNAAA
jgi:hypothetical protein